MKLPSHLLAAMVFGFASMTVFAAPNSTRVYQNPDYKRVLAELHELKAEVREIKSLMIKHYQASNQRANQRISHPAPPVSHWSCYINTPFNGSFTANGRTKNEALGKTLGKCNHKTGNSSSCDDHKVSCSKE